MAGKHRLLDQRITFETNCQVASQIFHVVFVPSVPLGDASQGEHERVPCEACGAVDDAYSFRMTKKGFPYLTSRSGSVTFPVPPRSCLYIALIRLD